MNKKVLKQLSEVVGITVEELSTKLKAEGEQALEIKGKLYSEETLTQRIQNDPNYLSPEDKTTLIESTREGALEVWAKRFNDSNELGLIGQDRKNIDKVIEVATNKATKDPDGKLEKLILEKEKWETERTQLVQLNKTKLEEADKTISSLQKEKDSILLRESFRKISPKETVIPADKIINLFNLENSINKDEKGREFVKDSQGNIYKDENTFEYLKKEDVYANYAVQYQKTTPGRGQGSGTGTGKEDSLEEFNKNWEASGKSLKGLEYAEAQEAFLAQQ